MDSTVVGAGGAGGAGGAADGAVELLRPERGVQPGRAGERAGAGGAGGEPARGDVRVGEPADGPAVPVPGRAAEAADVGRAADGDQLGPERADAGLLQHLVREAGG